LFSRRGSKSSTPLFSFFLFLLGSRFISFRNRNALLSPTPSRRACNECSDYGSDCQEDDRSEGSFFTKRKSLMHGLSPFLLARRKKVRFLGKPVLWNKEL